MTNIKKNEKEFISMIFVFGFIIRMLFLFLPKDMWHDASFSVLYSQKPLLYIISSNDVHPPLYYLILKPILFLTTNEFIIRALSLMFFVLLFFVLYNFLKKHFDFYTRCIVMLFITLSPTMIYYSIEPRNYMLGMLFVILQVNYFFNILKKSEKHNTYFILFSFLMLYTHYYTAFILLVEAIYLIYLKIKVKELDIDYKLLVFLGSYFIIFLSSIPLFVYFFKTLTKMQSMWFKDIDLVSYFSTFSYQFIFPEMVNPFILFFYYILFITLCYVYYKNKTPTFYLMLFFIPVTLLWLISQISPVYHHRFFLFFSFGLYIFIAKGISYIYKSKYWLYGVFLLGIFISILLTGIASYDELQNKELYESQKELKYYLDKNKEYIFIHESPFSQTPMKYYFRDWNITHYLSTNLTRKQLFTAGGSIIENNEIHSNIDSVFINGFNNPNHPNYHTKTIYIKHEKSFVNNETYNIIYNNGGLIIYD